MGLDSEPQFYRALNDQEACSPEQDFSDIGEPVPRRYLPSVIGLNSVLSIVLLILALLNFRQQQHTPHPHQKTLASTNCGNTSSSAKAAGCIFDPLGYLWVPPECYDHATASEFRTLLARPSLKFGAFPFFRSNNLTDRILNEEELSERVGMKTWSSQEEHLAHCAYMLRRLERAREGKFRWDGIGGWGHIEHCSNALVERITEGENPLDATGLHSIILLSVVEKCEDTSL